MNLHGKNFIGRETSGEGMGLFNATNPASGARLEPGFHEGTEREAARALELAAGAFPELRKRTGDDTATFLERIANEILALGDDLVRRAGEETGLPAARLQGERGRTVGQIKMFAALVREGSWVEARIDRAIPGREPSPRPDLRRLLMPIGPVAVFGASNFPLAFSVVGGDTVSALAAGNPVVVKAHPAHPGTCELAAQAVLRAAEASRMPEGVFSMLHGAGNDVGMALARHPLARAVAFTGSLRGGRALHDAAAQRPSPIPVYAEMGSINPVFVLPGALAQRAEAIAEGLVQSVTLGVGQFCTNPGVVVGLVDPHLDRFVAALDGRIAGAPAGTMLHAGILAGYEAGSRRLGETPGVSLVARSNAEPNPSRTEARAAVFGTEARTFLERPELSEEVFGPSTLLVRCASRQELLDVARGLEGHLTATIHGTERDLAENVDLISILETKVGRLILNGFPTGVEVSHAMHHGGPYPATTDSRATSVGTAAIQRFARPVCYQNWPLDRLPAALRNRNERRIWRLVDGEFTRADV